MEQKKSIKFLSSESPLDHSTSSRPPEVIQLGDENQDEKLQNYHKFLNKVIDAENLVVLAGSGTSLTFNIEGQPVVAPSMWDLWQACLDFNSDLFKSILSIVKYDAVAPKKLNGSGSKEDIELLLSLCDSYLTLNCLTQQQQGLVSNFLVNAKHTILNRADFTRNVSSDLWSSHDTFIKRLGRRNPKQKRLKLFTTNYDLAFETAASNTGMIVIDGFDYTNPARFNPAWFNYDIVNRNQAVEKGGVYLSNVFQLYKIHGSVDWIRLDNGEIQKHSFLSSSNGGKPVFIYPSSSKYQHSYDTPYLDMISAFLETIQKPKVALLCLGFGFNDKHINNAISMALRTNPEFMVMVATKDPFNPEGSFNANIRGLMQKAINAGDSRIAMSDCTFDVFASLLPDRYKATPEEKLFKLFEKLASERAE